MLKGLVHMYCHFNVMCMYVVFSLVPRRSHHSVFGHLQYAKMEGEGLVYVNDVNVYLGRQRVGWVTNQKNAFHVRVLRHKQQVVSSTL